VGRTITTGTNHALSYTPTAGPKICKVTVVGGLRRILQFDGTSDAMILIRNAVRMTGITHFVLIGNAANFDAAVASNWPALATFKPGTGSFGSLSSLPKNTFASIDLTGSIITGPLTDIANLQYGTLNIASLSPASIAGWTSVRSVAVGASWNQAGVDTVISSMWGARANYTYATPSLQIGGTNAAPSGSYIAPEEGTNWHEDTPGHWVPLTGKAMIYDLINDVNGEGFNLWGITFTA
jgi:hypothetical protein